MTGMGYFDRRIHQVAALPLFETSKGGVDICLVTARGSGRWIIPKGNLIRGLASHEVAAQEALEEAGLVGQIEEHSIGTFEITRWRDGSSMTCSIETYLLRVDRQIKKWPERNERSVIRCDFETALSLVDSPSLAALIEEQSSQAAKVWELRS